MNASAKRIRIHVTSPQLDLSSDISAWLQAICLVLARRSSSTRTLICFTNRVPWFLTSRSHSPIYHNLWWMIQQSLVYLKVTPTISFCYQPVNRGDHFSVSMLAAKEIFLPVMFLCIIPVQTEFSKWCFDGNISAFYSCQNKTKPGPVVTDRASLHCSNMTAALSKDTLQLSWWSVLSCVNEWVVVVARILTVEVMSRSHPRLLTPRR